MLNCEVARPYISAAWLDTPESMIVRKMRNNAIKKYPKDFNSIASQSILQMDETYQEVQEEIKENANSVEFVEGSFKEVPQTPQTAETDIASAETPDCFK